MQGDLCFNDTAMRPHLLSKSFSAKSPSGRGGERMGRGLPRAQPCLQGDACEGRKQLEMVMEPPIETTGTLQEDNGPELGPLDN